MPPVEEPPREVGGLGLISRGSAKPEEEEEEEEEDGEVCALGSSGGSGAISGGGSGGWGWGTEVRVKARGSTLGEMMRCFVLLHLWVRLPEPAVEGVVGREGIRYIFLQPSLTVKLSCISPDVTKYKRCHTDYGHWEAAKIFLLPLPPPGGALQERIEGLAE